MITQALAASFKAELLAGVHDFSADTFKCMLFKDAASIAGSHGSASTNYSDLVADEVSGTGYTAGGVTLTTADPVLSGGSTAVIDFVDAVFSAVTLTTRGCAIYNSSKSNRLVGIWDFGTDKIFVGADCTLQFPAPTADAAIIRLG